MVEEKMKEITSVINKIIEISKNDRAKIINNYNVIMNSMLIQLGQKEKSQLEELFDFDQEIHDLTNTKVEVSIDA